MSVLGVSVGQEVEDINKGIYTTQQKQDAQAEQEKQAQKAVDYDSLLNDKNLQEMYLNLQTTQQNKYNNTFYNENNEGLLFAEGTKPQTQETQQATQKESQIIVNDDEAMIQQATQPQRYRNSGIAYFDNKKDLSIADAFLASYLKADIRLIDMNVNANVKQTNMNQALSKMYSTNNSIMQYTEGIDDYIEKDLGSTGDILSRGGIEPQEAFYHGLVMIIKENKA